MSNYLIWLCSAVSNKYYLAQTISRWPDIGIHAKLLIDCNERIRQRKIYGIEVNKRTYNAPCKESSYNKHKISIKLARNTEGVFRNQFMKPCYLTFELTLQTYLLYITQTFSKAYDSSEVWRKKFEHFVVCLVWSPRHSPVLSWMS
jgi:hypothetical protein